MKVMKEVWEEQGNRKLLEYKKNTVSLFKRMLVWYGGLGEPVRVTVIINRGKYKLHHAHKGICDKRSTWG